MRLFVYTADLDAAIKNGADPDRASAQSMRFAQSLGDTTLARVYENVRMREGAAEILARVKAALNKTQTGESQTA